MFLRRLVADVPGRERRAQCSHQPWGRQPPGRLGTTPSGAVWNRTSVSPNPENTPVTACCGGT